jgi:serine/threonine-protein kinase
MLYELLCGRVPFVADQPVQVLFKHCTDVPPPMSELNPNVEIPAEVNALVLSLLEKKPENRPGSAIHVKQRIQAILGGESSQELTVPVATFGTQPRMQPVSQPVSGMEMTISAEPTPGPGSLESIQASAELGEAAESPAYDQATGHLPQISAEVSTVPKRSPIPFAIAAALILGVGGFMLMPSGEEKAAQPKTAPAVSTAAPAENAEEATDKQAPTKPAAEPTAKKAAAAVATEPAPIAVKKIRLLTTPSGALVRDADKKLIGETPLELTTQGNDRVFSFEKAGFITASHAVSGTREGDVTFELTAKPKPKAKPKRVKRTKSKRAPAAVAPKPKPKPKPKKRKSRDLF